MLEHPALPTCHLYDVPRSLADHLCQLADVCYRYSVRGGRLSNPAELVQLSHKLGLQVQPEVQMRASMQQQMVLQQVLAEVVKRNTHTLYVVQLFNQLDEGCLCLVDRQHDPDIQRLVERYGPCDTAS